MARIDNDAHDSARAPDVARGGTSRRTLLRSLAVAGSLPFAAGPGLLRAQAQRGGTLVIGTAGIFPAT